MARLLVLAFKRSTEDTRQVTHGLGREEITLHEALDAPFPLLVMEPEPVGDLNLRIECEALFGTPRKQMGDGTSRAKGILLPPRTP
jgi:hypothetical protein